MMSLTTGTRLGPYEILAPIGAGGMGEVYTARDTKLGREVAIKVLPEAFAENKERLARFEREARLLASLNHPNIATLFDLQEHAGVHFLVLELVPGETLAERIKKGPIPVDEALPLFRQIAEGLEAAHEKGIIHRDLKSANIKVTPEGKVKVLDFGLAKAVEGEKPAQALSESPTLTRDATETGALLGTAPYMSPEQARGKTVDKRTDIWAFGCCFYEALTAETAFPGETISDTIARILEREPEWTRVPPETPSRLRDLLHRCLEKDPLRRLRDIGEARIAIDDIQAGPGTKVAPPPGWRRIAIRGMAAVMVFLAGVTLRMAACPTPTPKPPTHLTVKLPPGQSLAVRRTVYLRPFAISPDGTRLVYAAQSDDRIQLYRRDLDSFDARPLAGTEDAQAPFFSPDGRWVGFFSGGQLRKLSFEGGPPVTICDASVLSIGAEWGPDDTIIYAASGGSGLRTVPAQGGKPETLTSPDSARGEIGHQLPQILPDGKNVLFTVNTTEGPQIAVLSLETRQWHRLGLEGTSAGRYLPSGHLVYGQSGSLMAVPFDPARLELTGVPVAILDDVYSTRFARIEPHYFVVSDTGTLIYVPRLATAAGSTLVWVTREGLATPFAEDRGLYTRPRFSHDGGLLAVTISSQTRSDLWVYDVVRGTRSRLTSTGAVNALPVWTPDDRQITFASNRSGDFDVYSRAADGSGQAVPLLTREHHQYPYSWSSDGRALIFTELDPVTGWDIWVLPGSEARNPTAFLGTPFNEDESRLSPDGRWLAYVSDESGRREVYVQPFPGPGKKWAISSEGGEEPVWSPDGKEMFYRSGDRMMAVYIETEPSFSPGKTTLLFDGKYSASSGSGHDYDVAPDGRFLMIQSGEESGPTELRVVLNWLEKLKQRVPTR